MTLRPATMDDADFLLRLRNDPTTRHASRHQSEVTPEKHRAWLAQSLTDPTRALFIAEQDGASIGTGRLDRMGWGGLKLSLTIAPKARGQSYASALIAALVSEAYRRGATRVIADVRGDNVPSLRAFLRNGFTILKMLRMEKAL